MSSDRNILYFKKIIAPTDEDLKRHKDYLKKNKGVKGISSMKKDDLIKALS